MSDLRSNSETCMHTETTKHKQPSEVHELYGHYSRNDRCVPVEQIWHLREGIRVYKGCGHTHRREFIFRPSSQRDRVHPRVVWCSQSVAMADCHGNGGDGETWMV